MSSPYESPIQTPPDPPLQYVAPSSGRPVGVTVFAILNILFGFTGIIGAFFSAAMLFVGPMLGPNPVVDALQTNVPYQIFFVVSLLLGIAFSIALLCSGIGLLKMATWARKLAIAYGIYAIFATIVANVVNVFFVFMPMFEKAMEQEGAQQGVLVGSIIGAVFGGVLGLIFPVALLIYFLMPSVKQRFETWQPPPKAL